MSNKKRIIITSVLLVFLLVILKLFLGGPYLYNLLEELIPIIIILGIISIIMMLIPSIFWIKNKNKITWKKGIKVCFLNSLIIYILTIIPCINTIIATDNTQVMSFDPVTFARALLVIYLIIAIIYFFINMLLFVESKKKSNNIK